MKAKKKKIGYVVSLFPCWSETFILNEIIELSKAGYDITIFSIRNDLEKYTQEKAKPYLARTHYIKVGRMVLSYFRWLLRKPGVLLSWTLKVLSASLGNVRIFHKNVWCVLVAAYFADLARDEELKHLHAHFATYPALVATVMSKLTGIDYTLTTHAHDIFLDKTLLREKIGAAKAVATISQYNRRYLAEHCGEDILPKIHIVHCGLDLSEWDYQPHPNGHHPPSIVCVGRLTQMKGFENLIHALNLIKNEQDFRCHIVGDGDLRPRFEQLIAEYGLEGRVVLEGVLDSAEVRKRIKEAHIFAVPSVWDDADGQDGIPLVLMEALAVGTPAVASRISGIPELVIDGQTGLLAEPGDVDVLADKIRHLLSDKDLRARLATRGRERIEREFDIAKNARQLAKLF